MNNESDMKRGVSSVNLGWLRGWHGHSLLHGLPLWVMSQVNVNYSGYVATPLENKTL